jgi:AraC-like DNA-binding protein
MLSPVTTLPLARDPEDDELAALRLSLARRVMQLTPAGGLHGPPALPGVSLFRGESLDGEVCAVYEPSVALILQGSKRVVVGETSLVYGVSRYLLTSLELPAVATILEASRERPYLALVLRLDMHEIASLMLSDPLPQAAPSRHDNHAMATGEVTLPLLDAFRRLLELADRPQDVPVLAPLLQREIVYRLLTGEAGGRLRQIASADSQGHHIARAVKRLKTAYAEPLRVEDLAKEARMSVSTFHHRFKALTAMSPLQYQKRLRLAEARRMMLAENVDASTAAYRVGYESASQFSREYKRQFGAPPTLDIVGLREVAGARQS